MKIPFDSHSLSPLTRKHNSGLIFSRLRVLLACLWSFLLLGCAGNLPLDELPFLATETPLPTLAPTAAPVVTPTPEPYSITGLRNFFAETSAARLSERQGLVNRYIAQLPDNPLTGRGEAALVYQGPGRTVEIIGDLNNWAEPTDLTQLPDTDFWVLFLDVEQTARLDYLFIIDGREQLDPRNPVTEVNPLGLRSKLVMPGYVPPEVGASPSSVPAGNITQQIINSEPLGTRTVFVYTPAQPAPAGGYPAIYFLDGTDHLNLINTPGQLDRLIAAGAIPPVIGIFVPPIDRISEYDLNDNFVTFLTMELVPLIRSTTPVSSAAAQTVIVGQGIGGATAVYAALARPDMFGKVIAQSGNFTLQNEAILRQLALQDIPAVEFYLTVGTYETAVAGDDIIAINRGLAQQLRQKGAAVTLDEQPEGHSWGLWRDRLPAGLAALLN